MAEPDRPPQLGKEPPGKGGRPSVERAKALRDVMTHAVEVEKETRKSSGPPKAGPGRKIAIALSVPGLLFSLFSVIVRPEFIWGPKATNVPAAERDANLRFTMFLLGQRIRSFRHANGRLPATLATLGETPPGISYSILSDTVFQLTGDDGGKVLVLRSDAPVAEFLGDAARRLRGGTSRQ